MSGGEALRAPARNDQHVTPSRSAASPSGLLATSRDTAPMRRFFQDLSLSCATAGFVAVLVGFTSSIAIVFQAAQAFGATPAQTSSWMWALGLGMGLSSLLPSLWWRNR